MNLIDQLINMSVRLRRTKWMFPWMLGDELATMFARLQPETSGVTKLTGPTLTDLSNITLPPLVPVVIPPLNPLQPITPPGVITLPPLPPVVFPPDLDFPTSPNINPDPVDNGAGPNDPGHIRTTTQRGWVRAAVIGRVLGAGEGNIYTMQIYPNGLGDTVTGDFDEDGFGQSSVEQAVLLDTRNKPKVGDWIVPVIRVSFIEVETTLTGRLGQENTASRVTVLVRRHYFQPSSGGGGAFIGQVTGGTGSEYTVNVYTSGLAEDPEPLVVTQMQIDSTETIPAGTWAIIVQSGDFHLMQVPVWL